MSGRHCSWQARCGGRHDEPRIIRAGHDFPGQLLTPQRDALKNVISAGWPRVIAGIGGAASWTVRRVLTMESEEGSTCRAKVEVQGDGPGHGEGDQRNRGNNKCHMV